MQPMAFISTQRSTWAAFARGLALALIWVRLTRRVRVVRAVWRERLGPDARSGVRRLSGVRFMTAFSDGDRVTIPREVGSASLAAGGC